MPNPPKKKSGAFDYLRFLGVTAADMAKVKSKVPAKVLDRTIGPYSGASTPMPRGEAQPLNPINRVTPGDIADMAVPVRPAFKLGKIAGKAAAAGNIGGASMATLAALPLMIPGGSGEGAAMKKLLKGVPGEGLKHWATLTAENPGGKTADAVANKLANQALEADMKSQGIHFVKAKGGYMDPETKQWLAENAYHTTANPYQAEALGRKYKQNSVVTSRGFHNLNEGTINPSNGVGPTLPEHQAFTHPEGGTKFTSDINWDTSHPSQFGPQAEAANAAALGMAPAAPPTTPYTQLVRDQLKAQPNVRPTRARGEATGMSIPMGESPTKVVGDSVSAHVLKGVQNELAGLASAKGYNPTEALQILGKGPRKQTVDSYEKAIDQTLSFLKQNPSTEKIARVKPIEAPYLNLHTGKPEWLHERGVIPRNVGDIQGTRPGDPRLVMPDMGKAKVSDFVGEVANSKKVLEGMRGDVEKGRPNGGPWWYNLAGMEHALEGTPTSFQQWNALGSGASASNSVPNEFAAQSILNAMRLNGWSRERAVKDFLKKTRWDKKAPLMDMHGDLGFGAIEAGAMLPGRPTSESWKIPSYYNSRMGGGGLDPANPAHWPALDTKERMRLMQFAMKDPSLRKLALESGKAASAAKDKGAIPMANALEYQALTQPYAQLAREYGAPTMSSIQAPRWQGGWKETNLATPAQGDYIQHLEDALLYTAQQRGMDESPQGLQALFKRIAHGQDYILPWQEKGPYPFR